MDFFTFVENEEHKEHKGRGKKDEQGILPGVLEYYSLLRKW